MARASSTPASAPRLRSASLVVAMALALSTAMLGIVAWALLDARQTARRRAEQQASNVAVTLERDIGRMIGSLDLSLQAAVRGMDIPGIAGMNPATRQSILFDGAVGADGLAEVVVTDVAGDVLYGSGGEPLRKQNLADRGYFKALQADPDHGPSLGAPLRSRRSDVWILPVARAIRRPDGSFGGVVVSGVQLSYFQTMFSLLDIGRLGVEGVMNTDRVLIARRPSDEAMVGRNFAATTLSKNLAQAPAGAYQAQSQMDGVSRLYVYRKVGALPLVVAVGLATQEIYGDWTKKAVIMSAVLILLYSIGIALAWVLRREFQRRAQAEWLVKDAERQHVDALARLEVLFHNSPDALFIVRVTPSPRDPGDRFVYENVNPAWEMLMGISPAAALGRAAEDCLPAELARTILQAYERCVREGEPVRYGCKRNAPEGAIDLDVVVAPIRDGAGRISRLIGVGRNVTERNQFAGTLLQAQRMEAVGQLTTGVAHDFNNLLQAMTVALELLEDQSGIDQEGRDSVAVAWQAASRGAELVHQLLAFSRQQPLQAETIRPGIILPQLTGLFGRALGNRVRLEAVVQAGAWPILADRAQLESCLLTLFLNARDAMPQGGQLWLRAANAGPAEAARAGLHPGHYLRIEVEDTGAGMAPEVAARAFEPFFTTKPVGQGTGLGLSMVQGFARQSGGDARVASAAGRGTMVSLWLPRAAEPDCQREPIAAQAVEVVQRDSAPAA